MSIMNRLFKISIILIAVASVCFSCKKEGMPFQANSEKDLLNASDNSENTIISVDGCNDTIKSNNCLIYNENTSKPFHTSNLGIEAKNSSVAFIIPEQNNVSGPRYLFWDTEDVYRNGSTDINLRLINKYSCKTETIILTGQRYLGYGFNSSINNAVTSYDSRVGTLYISFDKQKNSKLKPGSYYGEFIVQARGWLDSNYLKDIKVNIKIDILNKSH